MIYRGIHGLRQNYYLYGPKNRSPFIVVWPCPLWFLFSLEVTIRFSALCYPVLSIFRIFSMEFERCALELHVFMG